jgi:hypothetical protein
MKFFKIFEKPSALMLAQQDLEECKRQYLVAKKAEEHYRHVAKSYAKSINRLENYIGVGNAILHRPSSLQTPE